VETPKPLSLGVEEEFQILCPDTLALAPECDRLIALGSARGFRIKTEIHQSCCEITTSPCETVAQLQEAIRLNRLQLAGIAGEAELTIGLSGAHPFSDWKTIPITQEPRRLFSEYLFQEAHRHCLAFALHFHICVPDRKLALKVMNDARSLLPILYALSCSSPFLEGRKTGLKSSRLLRAFGFPRTGIPDTFEDIDQMDRLAEIMQHAGLIVDPGQFWWDIRVHHVYPTVEFRICDAVPSLDDVGALASLIQAFVARLLDSYEKNLEPEPLNRIFLEENRWRAARFGAEADLLDYRTLQLVPLNDALNSLSDTCMPWIQKFNLYSLFDRLHQIIRKGSSAERQLKRWDGTDDSLKGIVSQYATETLAF
jgi:carboxylate-amine ligase